MHRLGLKNMHKIWDDENGNSLYLGDYYAASNYTKLKESKITGLLTAAAGLGVSHEDKSINHKVYNAWDMPSYNISKHFDDAFEFMESELQKGNILVHCAAGISRSATLVIMYLMRKNGWDLKRTVTFVRSKRPIICPNYGFMKHLQNFERSLSTLPNSKPTQEKNKDTKIISSKSLASNTLSKFSAPKKTMTKINQKVQTNLRDSKVQVSQLARSYYKPGSLARKPSLRPGSVQKPINHPAKLSSIPAWKQFMEANQPVIPRIVTIKP